MIKDHGWKKLVAIQGVLAGDQDPLKVLKQNEAAGGYSLNILADTVQFGTTDFQPILNKVVQAVNADKPDAILLNVVVPMTPQIYKGLRALGVTIPILTEQSSQDRSVFAMGNAAVEGMLVFDGQGGFANTAALPDDWPLKAGQLAFEQLYKAKYNAAPDPAGAIGSDWVTVLAAAMKQAGGDDKVKVQQALINLKDLAVLEGIVSFTPELTSEGIHGQVVEWQIKNGGFELIKTYQ